MTHPPATPDRPGGPVTGPSAQRRMVPLTVWLCSDTTSPDASTAGTAGTDRTPHTGGQANGDNNDRDNSQPAGTRPRPEDGLCEAHRRTVGHQLARHLIDTCTRVGDVVAEAFTTNEATLLAAADLNRHGIALVPHFPLARHIGARLCAALPEPRLKRAEMRPVRPDQMARGLADRLGEVGLVIAAPPAYETGGHPPPRRSTGGRGCPACRAEMWMLTSEQFGFFLLAARRVLRPGGVLAVITTARHQGGQLIDPAPRIVRQAHSAGFRYTQHVIALRVPIDGDTPVVQAGPADLAHLRHPGNRTLPPAVTVHADVGLFTTPTGGPQ